MRWYPWLRPHFEKLITNYQNRQGHHALLVQVLPGVGDDMLIYAIARFLLCQQPKGYKSCRKCRSCQLMQVGTHPDYHALDLKKNKNALSIDAVREINEKLYKRASLDGEKVVRFNDAALLTEAAVNALLKILEEPPEKTWFFLSCYEPGRLPATLRSRCRLYQLTAPKEEWAIGWLQRKITASQDVMLAALRLCSGVPATALELLQENNWIQRTQFCLVLGNALKSRDWFSLLTVINHEQVLVRLRWLITLLLDALKIQQNMTTITNVDVLPLVNSLAEILTSSTLNAIIYAICQCYKQILTVTSLNRDLVLTDLLLTIEHYIAGNQSSLSIFHF